MCMVSWSWAWLLHCFACWVLVGPGHAQDQPLPCTWVVVYTTSLALGGLSLAHWWVHLSSGETTRPWFLHMYTTTLLCFSSYDVAAEPRERSSVHMQHMQTCLVSVAQTLLPMPCTWVVVITTSCS